MTESSTDQTNRTNSATEDRVELLSQQVDALQVAVTGTRTPWYQQASTIVAGLAFLPSLVGALLGEARATQAEMLAWRGELRELILRLTAISVRRVEATQRYSDGSREQNAVLALVAQEHRMLRGLAHSIIQRIPNSVTAPEYLFLATAFAETGDVAQAMTLSDRSLEVASSFDDHIAAMQSNAHIPFALRRPNEGRKRFKYFVAFLESERREPVYDHATNPFRVI